MQNKKVQALEIDDELVDEIVDEILAEGMVTEKSKPVKIAKSKLKLGKLPVDSITDDATTKLEALENKVNEYVNSYKITAMEIERQITEKSEEFEKEQEKQLLYLQGQIENLRTAMIRLSNEFKKFKESISVQK